LCVIGFKIWESGRLMLRMADLLQPCLDKQYPFNYDLFPNRLTLDLVIHRTKCGCVLWERIDRVFSVLDEGI